MIFAEPRVLLVMALPLLGGCWLAAPPAPPPFDCARIDRAEERFPEECGDGGVGDDDAGP